ncbi:IspD/TarI family cytidylyltransferase [Sinomonas terrae]|uniref:2-C-methyl-D-erythritol 4-phosphate cytidylyltransferase n=1 Tax=Sinomonas terrae TaxID=2908838 RepID=A0ABS9U4K0_9MICC|nr:2-C-methyl-D-erythritol 4-phosphate cytidylyltransferase [Sinomonas terrae]MCH6471614.1 2-C-methyl-D-erythritol 4-phosphate cytidylyltransferase [Sinomonas terrae]
MTAATASASAPTEPVAVVVVAAGAGTRLGYGMPKALVPVCGEPMLLHALRGVVAASSARQICVAVPADDDELAAVCRAFAIELASTEPATTEPATTEPATTEPAASEPGATAGTARELGAPEITVVQGGATRAESVQSALTALKPGTVHVLVHDAARPLTPPEVFHRVVAALRNGAAAVIPAVPVVDTVKSVARTVDDEASVADEVVTGTPARETLRAVQTPQGFDAETLLRAHRTSQTWSEERAAAITDDAMLVESLGLPVYVVRGDARSLKITTPLDLRLAETLVSSLGSPGTILTQPSPTQEPS